MAENKMDALDPLLRKTYAAVHFAPFPSENEQWFRKRELAFAAESDPSLILRVQSRELVDPAGSECRLHGNTHQ
jgi:hypothetical protein